MSDFYVMDRKRLATLLAERGWLRREALYGDEYYEHLAESGDEDMWNGRRKLVTEVVKSVWDEEIENALIGLQSFHGLSPDGWAGPVTERILEAPRICPHPDVMTMTSRGSVCKWGQHKLTWAIAGALPRVSPEQHAAAFTEAWSYWSEVCNITGQQVNDANSANIVMGAGPIDRAGQTLAWSELPCNSRQRQLKQKYDTLEPWVIAANPRNGQIDLVRVCAHELGHALGIPHIQNGNLMQPMYDTRIRKPQRGDIAEMVKRYGEPVAPQPPVNPGNPGNPDKNDQCDRLIRVIIEAAMKRMFDQKAA